MTAAAVLATVALFLIATRVGPLTAVGPFGLGAWRWCAYAIFPIVFALLWLTRGPAAQPAPGPARLGARGHLALLAIAIVTSFVLYAPTLRPYLIDEYDFYGLARTYFPQVFGRIFVPGAAYFHHGVFRPTHTVTYVVDAWVWGDWRIGPHITTLAIFGAVVYVVGLLAFRLTGRVAAAVIAAALFGLHPANPEPAIWAFARSDSLCVLAYVGSLVGVVHFVQTQRRRSLVLSVLGFVAALLSKEIAVTLPMAVAIILVALPEGRALAARRKLALVGGYLAILALFFAYQYISLGKLGLKADVTFSPKFMLTSLASSAWWYLFFPLIDPLVRGIILRVGLALLLTLPIVALFLSRLRPPVPLALALVVLTLLPITPVLEPTIWMMNGRYVHLPAAFLAIALGAAFALALGTGTPRRRRALVVVALAGTLAGYATAAVINTFPWRETGLIAATVPAQARALLRTPDEVRAVFVWGVNRIWNPASASLRSAFVYDFWGARPMVAPDDAGRLKFDWIVNGRSLSEGSVPATVWDDQINMTERLDPDRLPRPRAAAAMPWARVLLWDADTGRVTNVTDRIRLVLREPCARSERVDVPRPAPVRTWGFGGVMAMPLTWTPSWCDAVQLRLTVTALATPHPYTRWVAVSWDGEDRDGRRSGARFMFSATVDGTPHEYSLPLGRDPRWMLLRTISRLALELPHYPATVAVSDVALTRTDAQP